MLVPGPEAATAEVSKESQVKAAFLFNFAQFVVWPAAAFSETEAPLRINVVGDEAFGAVLDEMVRGETVQGHPLIVHRLRPEEKLEDCQILFINGLDPKRVEEILTGLKGRPILTVSDMEGFVKRGGMIRFVTEKGKIRFRISLETARAAQLTISSKILKAAEIVAPGKD